MKEIIICLTTDYKLLLRTFIVHSQEMGKCGENCMKSFVTHPDNEVGKRDETASETRNLNKILVQNLNVIWET
jgi:hypothetical protein